MKNQFLTTALVSEAFSGPSPQKTFEKKVVNHWKTPVLILLIGLFLSNGSTFAQSFTDINQSEFIKQTKVAKRKNDKTGGAFSNLTGLEIKKVALVGFSMVTTGEYHKYGRLSTVSNATDVGVDYAINKILKGSEESLKTAFQDQGIELLVSADFSEDQKATLLALTNKDWYPGQDQVSFLNRAGDIASSGMAESVGGVGEGYVGLPAGVVYVKKSYVYYNELIKALGVDAVVIVSSSSNIGKSGYLYTGFDIDLIGSNPITMEMGEEMHKGMALKIFKMNYWPSVIYAESNTTLKKPVAILSTKKGEIIGENFDGAGNIFGYAVNGLMKEVKSRSIKK